MIVIWERLDPATFVADTDVIGVSYRLVVERTQGGDTWEWLAWPAGDPDLSQGGDAPTLAVAMTAAEFAATTAARATKRAGAKAPA